MRIAAAFRREISDWRLWLARVIVIEQIYRAWSRLNNHPYHRA